MRSLGIELLEPRALLSTLSFWGDSTTPAIPSKIDDSGAYELGLKFSSEVPGNIVGIRFYKGDQQATHTVSLWDPLSPNPSVALVSATSAGETSAGWQQVNFSTPYAIAAGSSYVASYYVPAGHYACDLGYFVGSGVNKGPLHAPYDGHSPSMLAAGASRPNAASSANFWVDVVFEPDTAQSPPWVSWQSPAPNATGVATNASVSGTFTEPVDPDTIAFELRDSSNAIVPGTFDYDSNTNTVRLTPASSLAGSSTYTATISGATDLAGNVMTSSVSWTFTTVVVDTTPPAVTAQSPVPGATNVSTSPSVNATLSEDVLDSSINFELRDASHGLISSTFSYNPATRVVTLVPASPLSSSSTYTATLSGATDLAGNVMGSPVSWSFMTAAPFSGTISLWDDATTPAIASFNDADPIELGVKFRSSTAGYITGLRFYKGAQNIGEHIGHLWSSVGASLATVTFVNETASGWQTVMFGSPVEISADTTYVASYHTNVGYYAVDSGYFSGSGFSNGPLTALKNGVDGGNGVFATGSASSFPTSSYNSANYWVDVIFTTSVTPVGPDITPAATNEDTQSASGLVITPNPADSAGVTHFQITGITHGTLYQSDGVTPINDGDFITVAEGAAGLKFTPAPNFFGTAGFGAQAAKSNSDAALKGLITPASITVNPVNDAPSLSGSNNLAAIDEDASNNPGTLVSDLVAGMIADVDSEAMQGIAITAVDTAHGAWQYTTDGGSNWTTIVGVADATALLLAADANTRVRFVPNADWNGTVSNGLTFRAWDRSAGAAGATADATTNGTPTAFSSATASASIVVNSVNDAPRFTKGADQVVLEDAAAQSIDGWATAIFAGPANEAGQALMFQIATNNDSLFAVLPAIDNLGKLTYTPAANASGTATVTVKLKDDGGSANGGQDTSAEQTFAITVNPVNDAPVLSGSNNLAAIDEDASNNPGTLVSDLVAGMIADVDSEAMQGIAITAADNANGTWQYTTDAGANWTSFGTPSVSAARLLAADASTRVRFVPNADWNGTVDDGLTFQAWDQSSGTAGATADVSSNGGITAFSNATASANITVNSVNDAPVAKDDAFSIVGNAPFTAQAPSLLANDADVETDPLTAILVTDVLHGTLVFSPDGAFTYTPTNNYSGIDSFTYIVSDGKVTSNVATVTIEVNYVRHAPSAVNDSYSTAEDTSLTIAAPGVLGNDTDVDGDTLTAIVDAKPSHGTLTLHADGSFAYTPNANYHGADSFTYKVSDGSLLSNTATVTITINPINDAPAAGNDSRTTAEDTPLQFPASDLLANDSDVDGDPLTVTAVGSASHGVVQLANGVITYTPSPNYHGPDGFTYTIKDPSGATATGQVNITVTSVNDAPVANSDSYSTNEDTSLTIAAPSVLGNDTDVDGDPLTAILGVGPTYGKLTLNANGSFTYTPDANFNGTDSFTYKASDGTLASNLATVTLVVAAVNDAPEAKNDSATTAEDTPLELPASVLLANDTDVDGDALSLVSASGASHGGVQVVGGKVIYTPASNYFGTDSFTYTISDSHGGTSSATVSVQITPVNDDPPAVNDAYAIDEDSGANALSVLSNDTNPDPGEVLTIVGVSQGSHGTVAITGGGTGLTYTPAPDFFGTDTFTYTLEDGTGSGKQAIATVTMTVRNINDAPVANNDSFSTDEDTLLSVPAPGMLANDTDVDGDALSAVLVSPPSHGSLTLNANGSFTYQPAGNYNGPDSFTYKVSDGQLSSAAATVSLTINRVNDPPVANDDTKAAWEDIPLQLWASDLLINDSDADADWLTVTSVGSAAHGTVQLKDGQITYQPAPNYFGADRFTYTISDGHGGTSSASVVLQVNQVNDPPVAVDDYFTIDEDGGMASLLILANDNAANPDPNEVLTIVSVSQPAHGTAAILDQAGTVLQYTPAADFFGTEVLSYTVKDPSGLIAMGNVTIVVRNVNDPPVAHDDSRTVAENAILEFSASSLLANDTDVDGDLLTVKAVGPASHGTAAFKDGKITYTPEKNFHGTDRFSYTISDPSGATSTAQVNLTVAEVIQNPVVGDDFRLGTEDTALAIPSADLLANDIDPNGYPLSIVAVASTTQTRGTVQLAGEQVIFTPAKDFNGITSFTYTVSDGHGGTDTGTVTVQVNAVNDSPVLGPISGPLSTDEGKAIGFQASASDVEGDQLTFSLVDAPSGATIDPATGAFSWTPGNDQAGTYSFSVRVTDNGTPSLSDSKAVTILVKDVPIVTPMLQVRNLTPTPSGFDIQFNMPIDPSKLNLYDGVQTKGQPADLTVIGASAGAVSGTAIWEPASNTLHFLKTGGVLAADTYTLTLFSRADGFVDLDGDSDGQAGGNCVKTVTIPSSQGPIVSLPDIARGPKQSFTLPIRIDEAAGVLSLRGELQFDPKLLNVSEIAALAEGWTVTTQVLAEGRIQFTAHANAALSGGAKDLLQVKASVPAAAAYGAAGMLKLIDLKVNDKSAVGDSAVQAVAYLGDASGNQRYGGLDAALISNVTVGICSGFDAYPLIDPLLIGDVSGNGSLGGLDAAYVAQKSIGMNVPQIPDLPAAAPIAPLAMKAQSGSGVAFAQVPISRELPAAGVLSSQAGWAADSLPFGMQSIDETVFG